jgi:hypothetical protein
MLHQTNSRGVFRALHELLKPAYRRWRANPNREVKYPLSYLRDSG